MTYNEAFYELKDKLKPIYEEGEAAAIVHLFMEHITGLGRGDRLLKKDISFNASQQRRYDIGAKELLSGRPLQYVTGSALFMDRDFMVNESVLIPRPETEELVQWLLADHKGGSEKLKIIDIGTGSGCIGISLAAELDQSTITCVDVSRGALQIATSNVEWVLPAARRGRVSIKDANMLQKGRWEKLGRYDIIISNPPYIPVSEKNNLHDNVKRYEPHTALFVPDEDPLIFYRIIAEFGKEHLRHNGYIYCELDAGHAEECKELFVAAAYTDVEIRKDIHGNWRMLKARLLGTADEK